MLYTNSSTFGVILAQVVDNVLHVRAAMCGSSTKRPAASFMRIFQQRAKPGNLITVQQEEQECCGSSITGFGQVVRSVHPHCLPNAGKTACRSGTLHRVRISYGGRSRRILRSGWSNPWQVHASHCSEAFGLSGFRWAFRRASSDPGGTGPVLRAAWWTSSVYSSAAFRYSANFVRRKSITGTSLSPPSGKRARMLASSRTQHPREVVPSHDVR